MKTGEYTLHKVQTGQQMQMDDDHGICENQRRNLIINFEESFFTFTYRYYYQYQNTHYVIEDSCEVDFKVKGALKKIDQTHFVCSFSQGDLRYHEIVKKKKKAPGKNLAVKGQFSFTVIGEDLVKIEKITFAEKIFRGDRILMANQTYKRN